MPYRPNIPCKHPGCAKLISYGKCYCNEHEMAHRGDRVSSGKRGYGSKWQKERLRFLQIHPLCVRCEKEGKYVKATVVDHIVPHRGDQVLFWDKTNWEPLCKKHHDIKTMTEDRYQEYHY